MTDSRRLFSRIIHPVLAVLFPWLFLVSIMAITIDIFPGAKLPWGLLAYLLLICLGQVGIANVLHAEKASSLARLRELFVIGVVTFFLFGVVPESSQFMFHDLFVLIAVLLVIASWGLSFVIQRNFRNREYLLDVTALKKGHELKDALRENGYLGAMVSEGLKANSTILVVLLIINSLYILLTAITGHDVSLSVMILVVLFFIFALVGIGIINMFKNDLFIMSAGVRIVPYAQRRRVFALVFWGFILAALMFLVASDQAMLSLPSFSPEPAVLPAEYESVPHLQMMPDLELESPFMMLEDREIVDLSWVLKLIQFLIIGAGVVIFTVFLFLPLIRGEALYYARKYNPFRLAFELISGLLAYCWLLLQEIRYGLKDDKAVGLVKRSSDRAEGQPWKSAKSGIRKQLEKNQILRHYLRFMLWGRARGYPCQKQAPLEYSEFLGSVFPALAGDFVIIASIFEQAVFSPQIVGRELLADYKKAVKRVLQERPRS